jgi:cytosine/adenosine deaminase-related metal-dependent hydrolase
MMGMGLLPTPDLLDAGVPLDHIGMSVDVSCQTCADPFQMMRIVLGLARNKAQSPTRLTPRQVLRMATLGGANVLGLEKETGSLTPGKRADLVMVRTTDINMIPAADINQTFHVVLGAQPANVDTVMIDGRIVKRAGRVLTVDVPKVVAEAAALQARLRAAGAFRAIDPSV